MSTSSRPEVIDDGTLHQVKGSRAAPEVAAEKLRKDLEGKLVASLHSKDRIGNLSFTVTDCTNLQPMIALNGPITRILVGPVQACHLQQLHQCQEAMEEVAGGCKGIADRVEQAPGYHLWGAMVLPSLVIL